MDQRLLLYNQGIKDAKTIVWNDYGSLKDEFATGTIQIAQGSKVQAYSLVGGGDSVAAIKKAGLDKEMTIFQQGEELLEFLEGKELPGLVYY